MSEYYLFPWLPVILVSIIWLGIGFLLFSKYFVMGLLGCTKKSDNLFALVYTISCILLWPIFMLWLFWGPWEFKHIFFPKKKVWKNGDFVTCEGKGGRYEVLCIAKHNNFMTTGKILMHNDISRGAGKTKGENLTLQYVKWERQFYYCGFTTDDMDRIFYVDTETGKYYHRRLKDFNKRMKSVK